jgi:hypothetical protein
MRSAWLGWVLSRRISRLRARRTSRAGTLSSARRRVAGLARESCWWWSRASSRSQASRSQAMATAVHQAWLNARA